MELAQKVSGEMRRFRGLLSSAAEAQGRTLQGILARNRESEYGRRHGFSGIRTYEQFCARVPIVTYEDVRADVERMAKGEAGVLIASPVVAFEETGGSSGGRKLIPHTAESLAAFRRALRAWLDDLFTTEPRLASGTAYWSISPACRAPTSCAGGIAVGINDAEYFGTDLAGDILQALSVPPNVGAIADFEEWRCETTARLLADERLAWISVWSPTFLQILLRCALERGVELVARHAGRERVARVQAALGARWVNFRDIWPDLRLISCWDQAASRSPARELTAAFPGVALQGKGLLATEGIVSIPLSGTRMPVLAIESGFYEFVAADGSVHPASDVVAGEEYQVLLTNDSGLYRYAIGDRVRVHELVGAAPTLEFLGRSAFVSDLCGEKLTEDFVLGALREIEAGFCVLTADGNRYVLLLDDREIPGNMAEAFCRTVDAALERNPQYAYARRMRQLAPVEPMSCRNPMDGFTNEALRQGRRLGDVKAPALYTGSDWRRVFNVVPS